MAKSKRIASIDWMRGFVMILMVLDHVSMAYDAKHNSSDSAALYVSGTELPAFDFFTRWISYLADIQTTYIVTLVMLILLYPFCLWYRQFKLNHLDSIWLRYL